MQVYVVSDNDVSVGITDQEIVTQHCSLCRSAATSKAHVGASLREPLVHLAVQGVFPRGILVGPFRQSVGHNYSPACLPGAF